MRSTRKTQRRTYRNSDFDPSPFKVEKFPVDAYVADDSATLTALQGIFGNMVQIITRKSFIKEESHIPLFDATFNTTYAALKPKPHRHMTSEWVITGNLNGAKRPYLPINRSPLVLVEQNTIFKTAFERLVNEGNICVPGDIGLLAFTNPSFWHNCQIGMHATCYVGENVFVFKQHNRNKETNLHSCQFGGSTDIITDGNPAQSILQTMFDEFLEETGIDAYLKMENDKGEKMKKIVSTLHGYIRSAGGAMSFHECEVLRKKKSFYVTRKGDTWKYVRAEESDTFGEDDICIEQKYQLHFMCSMTLPVEAVECFTDIARIFDFDYPTKLPGMDSFRGWALVNMKTKNYVAKTKEIVESGTKVFDSETMSNETYDAMQKDKFKWSYPLRYQRCNTFTCTFNDSYDDSSPRSYTAQSYEIPMS